MTAHPSAKSDTPRLPTELLGSVPRDVRLTGGGLAVAAVAIAIAIGALAAAIFMSIAYARTSDEWMLREREAVAGEAEVVQVIARRGEPQRRDVKYRYYVDGRSYTGQTRLRKGDRRDMAQGSVVPIAYVASQPEKSWMVGYRSTGFPVWMIPLTVLSLLATAAAISRGLRRQWILLSEGRPAQARVTGLQTVHNDERRAYRVSYEFQTLSGATQTSRCEVGKAPPPVGAVIPIVYHRDKPDWSAAYPLQLVRPGRLVN
jgi:hypothetical protein